MNDAQVHEAISREIAGSKSFKNVDGTMFHVVPRDVSHGSFLRYVNDVIEVIPCIRLLRGDGDGSRSVVDYPVTTHGDLMAGIETIKMKLSQLPRSS